MKQRGNSMTKKKSRTVLLLLFCIILAIQTLYLHWIYQGKVQRKEEAASDYAQLALTTFCKTLDKYEYLTDAIRQGVISDEEVMEEHFDNYGRWMLANEDAVKAVYLCKNGYFNYAYPAKENAEIMVANLFNDFLWSYDAEHASELKHMIIVGPVMLHDGGNGFIYYNPVYIQEEESERFWGVVLTVLDADIFAQELQKDLVKLDEYSVGFYREVAYGADVTDDKGFIMNFGVIHEQRIDIPFEVNGFIFHVVIDRGDGWEVMEDVVPIVLAVYGIGMAVWLFVLFLFIKIDNDRTVEMQRKINEAKMDFFSNMSHDMRTPLNGIIGLLEISASHKDNQELMYKNMEKAMAAASHLKILINNTLDIGRISIGPIQLENVPFDLAAVCDESYIMVESQAELMGITISQDRQNLTETHLIGSPIHLKEILINIYSNAMKYNKKNGQIHVSVSELSQTPEVIVYEFKVQDSGIGMSEEFIQNKLFCKYEKNDHYFEMQRQDTGLGMSIVKKLIDEMNGTIQVDSVINEGTTITIRIPFAINHDYEAPVYEKHIVEDLTGLHILLTDDVKLNLDIEAYMLRDRGAEVTTAHNGEEAFSQFMEHPEYTYDVIMMDLKMPVMDGYEATKRIRQSNKKDAETIPIIAVTANAFDTDIEKCYKAGMNEHVAKPLDQKVVLQIIQKVTLNKKGQKNESV